MAKFDIDLCFNIGLKKGGYMKKYKINDNTLALIPLNKHKTVAYEDHNYYIIDDKVSSVLNENCEYYGSSVSGRLKGSYSLMGFSYKTPIVVSEQDNMIFFPTSSPRLNDCSWINVNNIRSIDKNDKKTTIIFTNGEEIEIEASYNIIKNQYFKSLQLNSALKNRKNDK